MITKFTAAIAATGLALILMTGSARGEGTWAAVVSPDNSFESLFAKDGKLMLTAQMMGWGPNWAWVGSPTSKDKAVGGKLKIRGAVTISGQDVQVACEAQQSDRRTVTYQYELTAAKDVPLMKLVTAFAVTPSLTGEILVARANGKEEKLPIPQRIMGAPDDAAKMTFKLKGAGDLVMTLDPPCRLHEETGATRVELAHDLLKAGKTRVTLTIRFPGPVSFLGSAEEQEKFVTTVAGPEWFPFKGSNDVGPSAIGFQGWLEKPAGKHGGVRMKGSRFVFEDGTPVKFWGTNLSYRDGAPEKPNADLTAARFAKWGVNAVRLHKPFGPGWEGIGDEIDGTKLTAKGLDQMDYFMAKLKQHGVYYGLSHTYGYRIRPGNREQLPGLRRDQDGARRQHVRADQLRRRRTGPSDRERDRRPAAQESIHRSDVGRGSGAGVHRVTQRGRHFLLHHRERVDQVPDLPQGPGASVRPVAEGEVRHAGGFGEGLAGALQPGETLDAGKTSPSKETRGSAATACRRRPAAARCGSWTTPPFSMPCRTSSMASS